jgi:hypothetical protein
VPLRHSFVFDVSVLFAGLELKLLVRLLIVFLQVLEESQCARYIPYLVNLNILKELNQDEWPTGSFQNFPAKLGTVDHQYPPQHEKQTASFLSHCTGYWCILSRVVVTIDGYWFDKCVYWITVYTLQFTTVHTLYNSQQLSPFSSSEDSGSNSATTAATHSYWIPCHH